MTGFRLTLVQEQFFGEQFDSRSTCNKTDGNGNEKSELWRGVEVDGGGQDSIGLVEKTNKKDTFPRVIGETKQATSQYGKTHLCKQCTPCAVLLKHCTAETKPSLLDIRSTALLEGLTHACVAQHRGSDAPALISLLCLGLACLGPVRNEGLFGYITRAVVLSAVTGDDIRNHITMVAVFGELEAHALEVRLRLKLGAFVDGLSVTKQDEVIEEFKNLGSGLMNNDDNGDTQFCNGFERSHDG
ncbi:hypothetical protein HG530_014454 [Fusarium avenaceum]|nr:hypothetical protein HG530_014454 [Fusarium avenaceum]